MAQNKNLELFEANKKSRDYKRLLLLSYSLMMNIRKLGSIETVGVKLKDDIWAELCLKLWFESDWYFCNSTKTGWF